MRLYRLFFYLLPILVFISCTSRYEVFNKGIAGNNSSQLLQRVEADVIKEDPDFVLLMVGTNDMINSKKFLSFEAYFYNLSQIIAAIKSNNSAVKILLSNLLPVDEDYVFERHDRTLYSLLPNAKIDSLNRMLRTFAMDNSLILVDVNQDFRNSEMTYKNSESLLMNDLNGKVNDGVHPTREGYQLIARSFYQALKTNGIRKRNIRIICFGDSITYGAFMEGKGTSTGDTYPAVLLKLLNN